MTKEVVNFYETHKDFVSLFADLKECTTQTIEELCTKIIDYVKSKENTKNTKDLLGYAKKRLYTGLCGKTNATRRGFTVSLIRLLREFPELQESAYPDMIKYTKPIGKVEIYRMTVYFIGRIFGYNILLRLGLMSKIKQEILLKITQELVKFSKDSLYVEDLCITTLCSIYDETEDDAIADIIWKSLPSDTNKWTPFHIGVSCHILSRDLKFAKKLKKKLSDPSIFLEKLFIRQCEGEGDAGVFAWKALARYAMMDATLPWKEFWKDMRYLLTRPVYKIDFSYHVFTAVISALPGFTHRIEEVLAGEFSRQFVYWVKNGLNLYNLRRVFLKLVEEEDSEFLFQLAAALIGVKDFDKRIGAPIYETILKKPESKNFDFGVIAEGLVNRWIELRKPFVEATEEEEEDIDEVSIEIRCQIINEKLQRLCVTKEFKETANPDWWVVGVKFFLRLSYFHAEAKRAKMEVAKHQIFTRRGLSIVAAQINFNLPWLQDDGWKIDRIFELVDVEAMLKQYGPRLINNADPTPDFKLAETFLKKLPTMELTVVQRRLCELIAKTCRILLITELYNTCSKVLQVLLQDDLSLLDKMFEVVLELIEDKSRILYDLAMLIWKIFAKDATNEQVEQLIEMTSPNERDEGEDGGDAAQKDGDAGKKKDKTDKSQDVDEAKKVDKGKDDNPEPEKAGGDKAGKIEGDKSDKSPDVDEPTKEEADQGDKPVEDKKAEEVDKSVEDKKIESVENNADGESSSSSSDDDKESKKGEDGQSASSSEDEDGPSLVEMAMIKNVVMGIVQRKGDRGRRKEIQITMIPKVMRLMEIFVEHRVGDSLILTMISPLLERYCKDPNVFGVARRLIIKITRNKKEEELLLKGVDMATMQDITSDAIHVMLTSKSKKMLEWVHRCPILWLFKLYFKVALKEGKLAEAQKWAEDQYNIFWSGLINHENRYKYISLQVFRDGFMRFPILVTSMLKHVFETVEEGKITRPFNMFETLCFISQAAVLREKEVITAFKAFHVDYAKTFCKLRPRVVKKLHKKTIMQNMIKFVKTLSPEEKSALLKNSDLEKDLSKETQERPQRLLAYLRGGN